MRKGDGGYQCIVLDTHTMVVFVLFLQTSEDAYGLLGSGLVDHHRLKTAFEGLVLLEVFLVFLKGSGTYASELTSGEGRLEDVGGIHGSVALSGPHKGMDLINEEDDATLGFGDLTDNALQTVLELSLVHGTCHKGSHVE